MATARPEIFTYVRTRQGIGKTNYRPTEWRARKEVVEISEIQSSELAGKKNSKYWNQSIKKRNLRSRWGSTNRERCTCTWGNNVTAENYKSTGEKGEYTERGTAATRFSFSITFLSLCYSFLWSFLFFLSFLLSLEKVWRVGALMSHYARRFVSHPIVWYSAPNSTKKIRQILGRIAFSLGFSYIESYWIWRGISGLTKFHCTDRFSHSLSV